MEHSSNCRPPEIVPQPVLTTPFSRWFFTVVLPYPVAPGQFGQARIRNPIFCAPWNGASPPRGEN